MPELPEVEVVKRSLMKKTQNIIVKAVKINDGRLRYKIDRKKIKKIIGLKLKKISRRSKYLLFFFNKDLVMLVHLGMTGKFFFINHKRRKYKTSFYYDINEDKDNNQSSLFENNEKFNNNFDFLPSKPWKQKELLSEEFKSLGFYISNHPLNEYANIFSELRINSYDQFYNSEKKEGIVAGTIMSIQEKKAQRAHHMQ